MRIPDPVEFETCPEGTYPAICTRVVELGKQATNFGPRNQISLAFEPIGIETSDGVPFTIWRHGVTLSTAPGAALMPILTGLLGHPHRKGAELDLGDLVGLGCEITIEHKQGGDNNDRTFANIVEFGPWPEGRKLVKAQGKTFYFSLADGSIDQKKWGFLSQRMQDKIAASPEYKKIMLGDDGFDEDTALSLAKPSRRNGNGSSDGWHPDKDGYYPDGSRSRTQEEAEREAREAGFPDNMEDLPF